jgi:hypothetical protein
MPEKKLTRKNLTKLNYGIIHSQVGFADGVSIVMKQIEQVMVQKIKVPKSNIFYLVGKAKTPNPYTRQHKVIWHKYKDNKLFDKNFSEGLGGELSEKIEKAIELAKEKIREFVNDKNIDVIIAHNTSHPVNFVLALALSRYYRDEKANNKKTPKYILWWHDSHLERERYLKPTKDIWRYLLQGVPGEFVDYIIFINSLQFEGAQKYIHEIDKISPGYSNHLLDNHCVVYNTASRIINTVEDLENKYNERTERFLKEYKINELLKNNNLKLNDTQFVLQHTRIIPRKRIDFALEYSYELFSKLKKEKLKKGMIFIISGYHGDESGNYKRKLIRLNKKLSEKYKTNKFFLILSEDKKNTDIHFDEIPILIRKLGGISTYFSEIEGFGNNLLEVLAAGLIPAVYTYPVFKKDLAKFKFKTIALNKFEITSQSINDMIKVIKSDRTKTIWANQNLEILRKKFSHEIIAPKLKRAIIRKRNQE